MRELPPMSENQLETARKMIVLRHAPFSLPSNFSVFLFKLAA